MTAVADLPVIALAQMEVRPGRPDLNVERMEALITEARAVGARNGTPRVVGARGAPGGPPE